MTATKATFKGETWDASLADSALTRESPEEAAKILGIPYSLGEGDVLKRHFIGAYWTGQEFEALESHVNYVRYYRYSQNGPYYEAHAEVDDSVNSLATGSHELVMTIYYPLDPAITVEDIEGARFAYMNADSSGWLFAHTREGTHHDYELMLMGAIDGVFQPYFRQLQVDALNTSTRTSANDRFKLLSEFYGSVVVEARKIARGTYLGEREQSAHPREGWLDKDITAAVLAVRAKWAETRATDAATLSAALTYVERSLTMPSVETRWDRAARLKREAKENEE